MCKVHQVTNTNGGNIRQEIPGNNVREIRDRPVNTGKYKKKKNPFEWLYFPIKKSYEVEISKFNTYTNK